MRTSNSYTMARDRALNALVPARTDTYSPIPHATLIQSLTNKINNTNRLEIIDQRMYSNRTGEKLVGFLTVKNRMMENDPDYNFHMMLGYQNSYDKSMVVGLAVGLNVTVCSNGLIAGDMLSFKRKHTGTAPNELGEKIDDGIILMEQKYPDLLGEVDILRNFEMTRKQKAELLGVMYFEEDMMTPTQLSIVKREFNESEHFRGNTLWDLYNNVTEAFKQSHPLNHISDHIHLHSFMRNFVGIEQEAND